MVINSKKNLFLILFFSSFFSGALIAMKRSSFESELSELGMADIRLAALKRRFERTPVYLPDDFSLDESDKKEVEDVIFGLKRGLAKTYDTRSLLLHGDQGVDRSMLAKVIAYESGCTLTCIDGCFFDQRDQDIVTSLRRARELKKPAIIFIDNVNKPFGDGDWARHYDYMTSRLRFYLDHTKESPYGMFILATDDKDVLGEGILDRCDSLVMLKSPHKYQRPRIIDDEVYFCDKKIDIGLIQSYANYTRGWSKHEIVEMVHEAARQSSSDIISKGDLCNGWHKVNRFRPGLIDKVSYFAKRHPGEVSFWAGLSSDLILQNVGAQLASQAIYNKSITRLTAGLICFYIAGATRIIIKDAVYEYAKRPGSGKR